MTPERLAEIDRLLASLGVAEERVQARRHMHASRATFGEDSTFMADVDARLESHAASSFEQTPAFVDALLADSSEVAIPSDALAPRFSSAPPPPMTQPTPSLVDALLQAKDADFEMVLDDEGKVQSTTGSFELPDDGMRDATLSDDDFSDADIRLSDAPLDANEFSSPSIEVSISSPDISEPPIELSSIPLDAEILVQHVPAPPAAPSDIDFQLDLGSEPSQTEIFLDPRIADQTQRRSSIPDEPAPHASEPPRPSNPPEGERRPSFFERLLKR